MTFVVNGGITHIITETLANFLESHPADRVSRNLRRMLMDCLERDGLIEDLDFREMIFDFEGLFKLLEAFHGRLGRDVN